MVKNNGANLGFEHTLWGLADNLRGDVDSTEYKQIVLGLIFLKYIADQNTAKTNLTKFNFPKEAQWDFIKQNIKEKGGNIIDLAMRSIEESNSQLKDVLPKEYGREIISKEKLNNLIESIDKIDFIQEENKSKDILGRVYEYFLGQFAANEGRKGGEFYTPRSVVKLLVEMLEPYEGNIFDPCCGSGGMFIQSENFIEEKGKNDKKISIFGQESNKKTWQLCKMNLVIRGLNSENVFWGDSFRNDFHKKLKADFLIANPPFNMSNWGSELLKDDSRWKYGIPPDNNANMAWVQHFISHLSSNGRAGFVLSKGSLSSSGSGEGEIKRKIIEEDLIDCIVSLPPKLFYNTPIPSCLWFISKNKQDFSFRDRKDEILFIDASNLGKDVSRKYHELEEQDIKRISETYHQWRNKQGNYRDVLGFCKSVKINLVKKNDFMLIPSRYVEFKNTTDSFSKEEFNELLNKLKENLDLSCKFEKDFLREIREEGT